MAEILVPRPAATVLTLRDGVEGYEILMLRRNLNSDFVGGAYVFPGGGVDANDAGPEAQSLAIGLDDEQASRRLGLASGGLAYYVASLRELFEEAGLLVASHASGERFHTDDEDLRIRMAEYRRAVNAGSLRFLDMLESEGLRLDFRGLEYVAHWVTPVGPPRRYDTRFFVALAPAGQIAAHDANETVADKWVRPIDALAQYERGELELILPTIRNLQAIAHFSSAREVLAYAKEQASIPRIEPRIMTLDGEVRIVLPGEPGYEE